MLNMKKVFLAFIILGTCATVFAEEGESIVFNSSTGNYLINHYSQIDKKFEQLIFIPTTKINPALKTWFKVGRGEEVRYGYTLTSGRDSQQAIRLLIFDPVSSVTTNLPNIPLNAPPGKIMGDMMNVANYFDTPALWNARMVYSKGQKAFRISWGYNIETGGLTPGSNVVFGFNSRDLPGIILAAVRGYAPDSQEIDGEELPNAKDGGFGQQYTELVTKKNFVPRPAAVPAIAVPSPFDSAVLLDRIQTQMHTWIGMELLDATYSSQLDRYFAAAADAYRHNQPKAGKEHIQTLRKMLKKEHEDADKDDEKEDGKYEGKSDDKSKRIQIDRLAAKVLDFDLKYVLKRMDGNDKD